MTSRPVTIHPMETTTATDVRPVQVHEESVGGLILWSLICLAVWALLVGTAVKFIGGLGA
jgi:hypothetical protein